RQNRNAIKQLFVKISRLLRLAVVRIRQRHSRRCHVHRIETGRHFLESKKTFHEQSRAGEEHERENNFYDHKRGTGAATRRAVTGATSSLVQRGGQIWMRSAPRGKQTCDYPNPNTHQGGKG